jgi:hypothetical protein
MALTGPSRWVDFQTYHGPHGQRTAKSLTRQYDAPPRDGGAARRGVESGPGSGRYAGSVEDDADVDNALALGAVELGQCGEVAVGGHDVGAEVGGAVSVHIEAD